jgi:hypothetical protein
MENNSNIFSRLASLNIKDSLGTQQDVNQIVERIRIANGEKTHGIVAFTNEVSLIWTIISLPVLIVKFIIIASILGTRWMLNVIMAKKMEKIRNRDINARIEARKEELRQGEELARRYEGGIIPTGNPNRVIVED